MGSMDFEINFSFACQQSIYPANPSFPSNTILTTPPPVSKLLRQKDTFHEPQ